MLNVIQTDAAPQAIGPYSQAVALGDLLFTSGQIPLTPAGDMVEGGIEAQTAQALTNLAAVVDAAGGSLNDVIKTTVFLADLGQFAAFNAVYEKHFNGHRPARSTVQVARLPRDSLVEIEAVVHLPRR
jgi:2-iminobutanoate/2-iminopropanoate deaminase